VKLKINYRAIHDFLLSSHGRVAIGSLVGVGIGLMLEVNKLSLIVWAGLPFLFSVLSLWPTVYLAVRTIGVVGGLGIGAGLLWAALFAGLSRWLFGLDEETALLWVGLPVLIAFLPFCIFVLPKHLRKAGIL
jgi:hypothetical protein